MGTVTLQSVVDYASTIGDLNPVLSTGGFASQPALSIANDVMTELLSQKFNWKFNRMIIPPFVTNSWQQDYASSIANIGWLEHAAAIDINATQLPKPIIWLEVKRDLEITSQQFGRPQKVCWLPNDQLVLGAWPGAGKVYTNPVGAAVSPANPPTTILDNDGNILVLKNYGTTGGTIPAAGANALAGAQVTDGTCLWIVVSAKAQGLRISPLPPERGTTYQLYVIAQAKPVRFTTLGQLIDPIPDDYAKYFQDGFIAYCHRHSAAPVVRARFEQMKNDWLSSLAEARGQGDRESGDAGFVPATSIMQDNVAPMIGPAYPWQY